MNEFYLLAQLPINSKTMPGAYAGAFLFTILLGIINELLITVRMKLYQVSYHAHYYQIAKHSIHPPRNMYDNADAVLLPDGRNSHGSNTRREGGEDDVALRSRCSYGDLLFQHYRGLLAHAVGHDLRRGTLLRGLYGDCLGSFHLLSETGPRILELFGPTRYQWDQGFFQQEIQKREWRSLFARHVRRGRGLLSPRMIRGDPLR